MSILSGWGVVWAPGWGGPGVGSPASALFVTRRSPAPGSVSDPAAPVSFSLRSAFGLPSDFQVFLDGVLVVVFDSVLALPEFQPGFTGTFVLNGFSGADISFSPTVAFPLGPGSPHTVLVTATVPSLSPLADSWSFSVRAPAFDTLRFAVPAETRAADPLLMAWLEIWDGLADFVDAQTSAVFQDRGLFDADRLPAFLLPLAFEDAGLVFPDFAELTTARLRRILKNADEIHATRYSLPGLQFYISLLCDATVTVARVLHGSILFLGHPYWTLPSPAMIDSAGHVPGAGYPLGDTCVYFPGGIPAPSVDITVTGTLSAEMKAFLRDTIPREILMADDPLNPPVITLTFADAP